MSLEKKVASICSNIYFKTVFQGKKMDKLGITLTVPFLYSEALAEAPVPPGLILFGLMDNASYM